MGHMQTLLYVTMGATNKALASSTRWLSQEHIKSMHVAPHSLKDTCMNLHRNWGKKKFLNVIKISQIYTRSKTFHIFPKLFLPKKNLIIFFPKIS
jgi:hypothetical protein